MEENTIGVRNIRTVFERETCRRHNADIGEACWLIPTIDGVGVLAICNRRAKRAGFSNIPSRKSLARK